MTNLTVYEILNGKNDGIAGFNIDYKSTFHANDDGTIMPARVALERQLNELLREELQHILDNSSGGGSWRRVILSRIEELEGQIRL